MLKLKELRQGKGLTQQDIAEILSIQRQAVSKLELGITTLNHKQVEKLTKALNLRAEEVLDLIGVSDIVKKADK